MGFLSAYSDTQTVPIGDPARGYWVKLRKYISQGAKTRAEKALQGKQLVNGSDIVMDMDVAGYRQLMVLASIAEWNLDDGDGENHGAVWKIDLPHVQMLPGPEFDRIWSIVDKLNAPATAEERRQFPGAGVDSNQDGENGAGHPEIPGNVLAPATTVAAPWHEPGAAGTASMA